jgi:hypothetical protein
MAPENQEWHNFRAKTGRSEGVEPDSAALLALNSLRLHHFFLGYLKIISNRTKIYNFTK